MSLIPPELKAQLSALTDWWEGAGVDTDFRHLERMLAGVQKKSAPSQSHALPPAAPGARVAGNEASRQLAESCTTPDELKAAIERFDGCDLKRSATRTVFADGQTSADIMVIGEAPGREEDESGTPFVGPSGQLLDKMLASIGLSRNTNVYLTNIVFWRPPGNRNPTEEELAVCRPFLERHITLIAPKLIIATGAVPSQSLLGTADPIGKLRGQRNLLNLPGTGDNVPIYPIYHPSYLLKRPAAKKQAWHDLLMIRKEMQNLGLS